MSAVISAIIVNYNAGKLLRSSVDSLLNSPLNTEIIVVDNASTDGSLDTLSGLPGVQIIKNSTNVGFAAACNLGIHAASARFLLFLNPDCYFQPGTLGSLLEAIQADERAGMVGGLLTNPDGTEQAGGRRAIPTPWRSFVRAFLLVPFARLWPRIFFDFHLHKQPLPYHPIEVEAISGACMMVRHEAVQEVGEWDEGYFLHCEDLDWCMRFRQKGWKVMFVPTARLVHEQGACSRPRQVFVEWHKHKGMMRFYHKFFQHQYPGMLMWLVAIGVWLRFGLVAAYHIAKRFGRALGLGVARDEVSVTPTLHPWGNKLKPNHVGVIGTTSFVGTCLLPLLTEAGWQVTAYSQRMVERFTDEVSWRRLPSTESPSPQPSSKRAERITPNWVCVSPIRVLPDYFDLLEAHGARRVVVLSSTSRFTKHDSTDLEERAEARRMAEAEERVRQWAESRGVEWVILRPTLIYGLGLDKNIAEIARFIRRFWFFPVFGKANGLRQPVHAQDVATACVVALQTPIAANHAYNLSGGETLTYRDMVARVFAAFPRKPRLLPVPLPVFRVAVALLRYLPRYRNWSSTMAERMNQDLVFDHSEAARDLGFKPRKFVLPAKDLPA